MNRTTALTVAVALLAVLAGCSGAPAPWQDQSDDRSDGDAENPTVTALAEDHESALRAAGNFSRSRTVTYERSGETVLRQETEGQFDLTNGTALETRNGSDGGSTVGYRAPDGKTYERNELATGKVRYVPPRLTFGIDVQNATGFGAEAEVGNVTVRATGTTEVDGAEHDVYEFAVDDGAVDGVDEAEGRYVVDDRGVVRSAETRLVVEENGTAIEVRETVETRAIGETTVTEPGWFDEALAEANRPGPTDVVNETFTKNGSDGTVSMRLEAEKSDLDRAGPGTGVQVSENPMFRNDFLDSVRAGEIARLYWPDSTESVEVTFEYDDEDFPNGEESRLQVVVFDDAEQLFVPIESTVNETENTVVATVEPVDDRQGRTYAAIDYRAYVDRLSGGADG